MTDARWTRVKALFQAAIDRPASERAAFLREAAGEDDDLRREVESLLASDDAEASFFDRLPLASGTAAEPGAALNPSDRIGVYEIAGFLGAGAMGEVYRARDTKLNRDVALKVLPDHLALDANRLARFRREAQVLASLNHPNIAAIYGFEESAPTQALVLELVDGPMLADFIARGPMRLDQALPMAKQIAEALEVAHEQGIIHRDLKPSNVKVRPDGVVKLLDFGLAKALMPEPAAAAAGSDGAPTVRSGVTDDGVIVGTAAYMSPEQAKGLAVDRRTDIWAFGCVLFEMLAGRPAFRGDTLTDLLASVVKDDPDWAALPAGTPDGIRTLLRRCLRKDARQRLQAIGDARIEIDSVEEPGREVPKEPAAGVPRKSRASWLPWVAFAVLAAGIVAWETRRPAAPDDPFANAQYTRITDWEGTEGAAEISPDGRFVALVGDKEGEYDIWLNRVGTGDFWNLTRDVPPLVPTFYTFRKIGFSGDGSEIWFGLDTGPSMAQMIMPLMGGTPRAFLDRSATAPSWSPDGRRVAYFKNVEGDPMFVADGRGADPRQIFQGDHNHNPVWSPDGEWIYFARGTDPTDDMDVWRIRPSGESLERLTERGTWVNFLAPLDARTLLYVGRAADRSGPWLWALDVERKVSRRVNTGLGQYISVSTSRDGRRVVATVANPTTNLWRVPLIGREAEEEDVEAYRLPTARALGPRFGGTHLFYLSSVGTIDGLWRVQDGQASEVWRGADGSLTEPPSVSRDGSSVAVISMRGRARHLVLVSADGRNSRTLAPSIEIEGGAGQAMADWSPDGKSIVAGGRDARGPGLFRIPVDGSEPVRLVAGRAANPLWSPDGNLIVFAGKFFTGQVELLGVRPDGTAVELPPVRTRPGGYRFLPDGSGLVYLPFIPSLDFWQFDFATRSNRQITRLSNRGVLTSFDITPDGKAIVFDRSLQNSNIVLIELSK